MRKVFTKANATLLIIASSIVLLAGGYGITKMSTRLLDSGIEVYADDYTGSNISAKIAAAYADKAGTSSSPTQSVVVKLKSNASYNYSALSIQIPNATTFPYIIRPILDCNGAQLTFTATDATPAIFVNGYNVGNSIGSGELRNCSISRSDANGPIVKNNNRMGWHMTNVALYGGQDSYFVQLTTVGNTTGSGYVEQTLLDNVAFMDPARDGIYVACDNSSGEGCGYQYNTGRHLRYEFNTSGHNLISFNDARINAFNGIYQIQGNFNGSGPDYVIYSTGTVLSTFVETNGEGNSYLKFGGGGVIDLNCRNLARIGYSYDFKAWCHGDIQANGSGTGLYGFLNGSITHSLESGVDNGANASATYDNGTSFVRFHGIRAGTNTGGDTQFVNCGTDINHPNAWDSTNCENELYSNGSGYIGFGPGFHDNFGSLTADHVITVSGNGITSSAYASNGNVGVSCTGAPTANFATVNGIITHC